jgi:hypothetical protein
MVQWSQPQAMKGKVSQFGTFQIAPSMIAATIRTTVTNQTVQFSAIP